MTSQQRVVVIGGGMAGARLARQLGAAGAAAGAGGGTAAAAGAATSAAAGAAMDVTVVGEEPHAPYNRVLLADVLAGQYPPEVVALPAARTRRLQGVRAVRIDRAERRVVCDDGGVLTYDTLVLATGANPVLPPLRGLFTPGGGELPAGVRAFRTMDDCLALRGEARPGVPAVVVGGGLLGVSAARALARCGAQVVLAHQGERLMERQLDADSAALLRLHLEELGVEVHTECRVRGLRTQPRDPDGTGTRSRTGNTARTGTGTGTARPAARALRAVRLADGHALDARLAVLACGVRPRTGLAEAAGLEVSRGVVVDDRLCTSDPHVYAIGDCAEHDGVLYGLAGPAQDQADALARVLTGDARSPHYRGSRTLTRLTLAADAPDTGTSRHPLDLAAFGDPLPRDHDDVVRLADATRGVYRKAVVRDDRLVGGILLGDLTTVGALARAWEDDRALPPEPLLRLLTHDGEGPR